MILEVVILDVKTGEEELGMMDKQAIFQQLERDAQGNIWTRLP